jgi:mono/diheme cytochrome c family protein
MERGMALFVEKCSSCHDPKRAFSVIKDPEIWAQTIKRMQHYSQGAISNEEAEAIVNFHVTEQQREIIAFRDTCTKCHNDERIESRSMSEEQWLATIKRMQQKAPELITDEKINLLAAYFHRRELAMARIFYGKCRLCHLDNSGPDSTGKMNGLIVLANEEFGRSMQVTDARNLISSHVQRQNRNMQIYEKNCTTCHPGKLTEGREPGNKEYLEERTRAEWISFIALLQGMELNKEIQNTINYQIEFHISKH